MAEKDKKYYWLKLKRDFFKRHDIQIIESMSNGKDYILFYLKLLCESVDHDGNLRFNEQIPYNEQMLSTITNTNVDIVRSAIKVFESLNMMEILDDGTYFMNEVNKMLGSETYWAKRKRIQKEKELENSQALENIQPNSNEVPTSPSKSKRKSIDKDKELESDKDKDIKPSGDTPAVHAHVITFEEQCFNEFWDAYPRKINKDGCLAKYIKIKHLKEVHPLIMESLVKFKKSEQWQQIKFIPHPTTFINQKRWEDVEPVTRDQQLKDNVDMDGWL